MSNRIRQLMQMREQALLAEARANRPIDLDDYRADLQAQLEEALQADRLSPIPLGRDQILQAYSSLLGPSMARRIVEQSMRASQNDIQKSVGSGDVGQLMRPMISSVVQLDR